jgi:hypothetical protein
MTANSIRNSVSPRRLVGYAAIMVASLGSFVLSNLAALNQNDFMYAVAPAVWAQNGALYTDVPFPQAPLSILLNSLLVAISGNVNIFLFARIVSMCLVLLAILLPVLNRPKVRDIEVWVLYVSLCLTNYFVVSNSREIGNYALSLVCLSAAVTIVGVSGSAKWRGFAAFMFIGLATSAKLYFIVISPALFLYYLINEQKARNLAVVRSRIGSWPDASPVFSGARLPKLLALDHPILPVDYAAQADRCSRWPAAHCEYVDAFRRADGNSHWIFHCFGVGGLAPARHRVA